MVFVLLPLSLAACGSGSTTEKITAVGSSTSNIEPTRSGETVFPPPVIVTVANPRDQKSFVASELTVMAEKSSVEPEATASISSADHPPDSALNAETVVPTKSPTPRPTFTPPPSPESTSLEHLWLSRPVPQDTTVWTDKAYPYGTTKGGTLRPHHGVEFNVPANTEVLAAANGIVRIASDDRLRLLGATQDFYGNVVVIEHDFTLNGQPVFTLYGHLSEILVEEGQEVEAREVIALSGSSGVADGAHLHFEVRVGENDYQSTRNPLLWLYPFPDRGVVAGTVSWPDGTLAAEVPLALRRLDALSPYRATTTYNLEGVNPDDGFLENFAFDDIEVGFYELSAGSKPNEVEVTFWVYPYQTTSLAIVLDG
jgi:murein DD-endopeptidase MepM/ murein hydrolase activator NlpD